jgi:DNA-binding transcriptional regulator YdaS (Cro superfamily)
MGLDQIDVFATIKQMIDAAGSQAAFARQVGVTPQYVSSVLNAQRPASDALLAAVGLRRVILRINVPPRAVDPYPVTAMGEP